MAGRRSGWPSCGGSAIPLVAGSYRFSIKITGPQGVLVWAPHIYATTVEMGDFFGSGKMLDDSWMGSTLLKHSWRVD